MLIAESPMIDDSLIDVTHIQRDERMERAFEQNTIFDRIVRQLEPSLFADDILPAGTLLECAAVDVLNGYINYVDVRAVITERDPEEDERYISISNQFYTHFHEFGTVVHVIGSSARHWWYFCYDLDANDCIIGRVALDSAELADLISWVYDKRVSGTYPIKEIDVSKLRGWRSFQ
jgi:hypothetical protein